jgi:pyruvate dehydrogenase E2 component (dihydrolipoamide acetyltransferase)
MVQQFRLPDLGEGITEGEVVRWLVSEGDEVKVDQPFAEIETDKAIVEMPSPFAGTVLKRHVPEKAIVKVGQVLMTVGEKGEAVPEPTLPAAPATEGCPRPGAPAPMAAAGDVLATPRVRKLAQDLGVALAQVPGTGPQGRITEDDVRAAKERPVAAPAVMGRGFKSLRARQIP